MEPITPTPHPIPDYAAMAELFGTFCSTHGWAGHIKREPAALGSSESIFRMSLSKGDKSVTAVIGDELVSLGGLYLLTRAEYDEQFG